MRVRTTIPAALLLAVFVGCGEPAHVPAPETYMVTTARLGGDPAVVNVAVVNADYFGPVQPMLGRLFSDAEHADKAAVVLVGDALWTERFERDPGIVGSELRVSGVTRTVVGVMPPWEGVPGEVELWVP